MPRDETPLTEDQKAFAEANHGLLLKFISSRHLDDEFYSILVERYLKTVVKYLESEDLQRYAFSTILWNNLRSELSNYWRDLQRMPVQIPVDDDTAIYEERDILIDNELWTRIGKILTQKQVDVILLRDQGFSNREIGNFCHIGEKAVEKRFARIRKRIKEKELDQL